MTKLLTMRERLDIIDRCKLQDAVLKERTGLTRQAFANKYRLCDAMLSNALSDKHTPRAASCIEIRDAYEAEVPFESLKETV